MDLTRLGRLQLDGLVQEERFDLILRSINHMAESARHDIRQLMENALNATGMTGNIVFETGNFPVSPLAELQKEAARRGGKDVHA